MVSGAAPRTIRETFEFLAGFDDSSDNIREFLGRLDWTGVTVHQIYQAFLDRLPESIETIRNHRHLDPLSIAAIALESVEFQNRSIELFLRAFPEKRRLLHVHVPKSAGTDLRDALIHKYPYIEHNHAERALVSLNLFIAHLSSTSRHIAMSEDIFLTGHLPILWYIERNLYRYSDKIFAILRHPHETAISLVNYRLRRISEDPDCKDADTKHWAEVLGVKNFHNYASKSARCELGLKMLKIPTMLSESSLIYMIGNATYETSLEVIICTNIEMVPIEMYKAWLRDAWGLESSTRANPSPQIILMENLDYDTRKFLMDFSREDRMLYDRVLEAHQKIGGTSVFGHQLLDP